MMDRLEKIKKAASFLETSALLFAAGALLYRSTLYWTLPPAEGKTYGTGDILDLLFAVILFVICCLCAASGVAISLLGDKHDKRLAYQPALIGILSFVGYDFIHPYMPRLL